MKHMSTYMLTLLTLFLVGVYPMSASEQSSLNWINFHEPHEQFNVSFPHDPVHMQFDLCEEDALKGTLNVYTTSLLHGVLMVNIIHSPDLPTIKDKTLDDKFFNKIFYSCFIRRIFYQPKLLKDNPSFKTQPFNYQGHKALKFSINYYDNQENQALTGFAILNKEKLYIILYITPEQYVNNEEFQRFIDSFKIS